MLKLEKHKFLILKLRCIGDTLTLLPIAQAIKKKSPECIVDIIVNKGTEELVSLSPFVDDVIVYDRRLAKKNIFQSLKYNFKLFSELRNKKYDITVDYTHGDRSAFISYMTGADFRIGYLNSSSLTRVFSNNLLDCNAEDYHIVDYQLQALKLFGLDNFDKSIELKIPVDSVKRVDEIFKKSGIREGSIKVVVHPGAGKQLREWSPQRFAEIADRIINIYQADVILVAGPNEKEQLEKLASSMNFPPSFVSNNLSLTDMAALFTKCDLLIGNDSAPGHIAAIVGCKTLSLFGPTFPKMWQPFGPFSEVIFHNPECCGCRQLKCIKPNDNCMENITVDEVWEKAKSILAELSEDQSTGTQKIS